MLQLEPNEDLKTEAGGAGLAAHVRVTPHELAEAVAKLEARREAEREQRAETIPIGEAVHQLNLPTSSKELLSEVEAVRKERVHKAQQEQYAQACKRAYLALFALAAFGVIVALGVMNIALRHRLNAVAQSFTPLPIKPLSQVPDNVAVHVSSDSLRSLASGLTVPDEGIRGYPHQCRRQKRHDVQQRVDAAQFRQWLFCANVGDGGHGVARR